MLKKLLTIMLALCTAMPLIMARAEEERIVLSVDSIVVDGFAAFDIAYEVYPDPISNHEISVEIADKDIAIVVMPADGRITFAAIAPGTTVITLKTPKGASASATVTVNDVTAEGLSFAAPEYTCSVNNIKELKVVPQPVNGFFTIADVACSDESIVSVELTKTDAIVVKCLQEGDAVITCTVSDRKGGTFTAETIVHSVFKPVEGIVIDTEAIVNAPGDASLIYHLIPEDASERNLIFSSSNPEVVIDDYMVDGMGIVALNLLQEGEAVVTLTAENGASASINVTVLHVEPQMFMFLFREVEVPADGQDMALITIKPDNASLSDIVFTSSDEEVASVLMLIPPVAMIKGGKEGTAVITGTLPNGMSSSVTVNVKYKELQSVEMHFKEYTFNGKGQSEILGFTAQPLAYSKTGVAVTSDDPEVAAIDFDGAKWNIISGKPGIATVTMTLPNGNAYTTKVTVNEVRAEEIAFAKESIAIREDETGTVSYTYGPANANGEITATIDDPSVAEIIETADGSITLKGLQAGTATLTVFVDENVKDTITIVVEKNYAACTVFGFCEYEGRMYWYEEGKRQGVYGDAKNITDTLFNIERGERSMILKPMPGTGWMPSMTVLRQ